jgi:hypothetical protein
MELTAAAAAANSNHAAAVAAAANSNHAAAVAAAATHLGQRQPAICCT